MVNPKIIEGAAAGVTILALFQAVATVIYTKSTKNLSYSSLFLDILAALLWLWYSIINRLFILRVTAITIVFGTIFIICIKLYYESG